MQVTTIIARLSLFAVILILTACNKAQPEGIAGLHLPDINLLFEDYELADSTGNYAAFAHKLVLANRDLNSSELYVEAASLYQQAGNTDSVAILLHKAIDHGMANPNILSRMNIPHGQQKGTAWEELRARLDSIHGKLGKVTNFNLQLEAMNQFWPYLDRALQDTSRAKAIFKEYIFSGPREIRDFYVVRYLSTEAMYGQMVNAAPRYYSFLKGHFDPERLLALKDNTTEGMQKLREVYPNAVFPRVYVVPGILNSGGTATEMGLFVGGDMYGKARETPTDELTNWQKDALMEVSSLPALTLHELMHFQQNYSDPGNTNNVLFKLVQEGVCDFLVELCTGKPMKNSNLVYLEDPANRERILDELKDELFADDLSKWMYNGGSIHDRPHDLGYTLGYLITKSYYENQSDKKQAIHELLNSSDLTVIIRESKYGFLLQRPI